MRLQRKKMHVRSLGFPQTHGHKMHTFGKRYPTIDAMQTTAYVAIKTFPDESNSTIAATGKQMARPCTQPVNQYGHRQQIHKITMSVKKWGCLGTRVHERQSDPKQSE